MNDGNGKDVKTVHSRLAEMDAAVKDLKNNHCLQSAWERVKAAAEKKAARAAEKESREKTE